MKVDLERGPMLANWVSTRAKHRLHRMEAIPFEGTPEDALARLVSVVETWTGVEIVERDPMGMHLLFRTRLLRFPDDVYFVVDAQGRRLHFRSQSRFGAYDLGTNRRRMRRIARQFAAAR
jgi:uncharacterized protein (DUF1499 family)